MKKRIIKNWKLITVFGLVFIVLVFFYDILIRTFFVIENTTDSRRDLVAILQLCVTSFMAIITSFMAFLTYRLQRQNNKFAMERINETKLLKANNVLYYLEDTVKKLANINFNNDELTRIFKSSREYRGDLNFLRQNLLTADEAEYIKDIFDYVDDFANYKDVDLQDRLFKIKPLYKLIVDLYISPTEIKKNKVKGDTDYIVNPQLLTILLKLRMYLDSEYNENVQLPRLKNSNILLELRGKEIFIKKLYDKQHFLNYYRGRKQGFIHQYEPFFTHRGNSGVMITYEAIYEGEVKNSKFDGNGRYDYYTNQAPFKNFVNSSELRTEGLNYDANAQTICRALNNKDARAYFEGEFKNGLIRKGTIYYKEHPNDSYSRLIDVDKK